MSHLKKAKDCAKCGAPIGDARKTYCFYCAPKKIYGHHRTAEDLEKRRARERERYRKVKVGEKPKPWYWTKEARKEYARNRRKRVIDFYGGKCMCCGESTFEFLALDHIFGGGYKERKDGFIGDRQIKLLLSTKEKRTDLQILCHNCNLAKGFYGKCPHAF